MDRIEKIVDESINDAVALRAAGLYGVADGVTALGDPDSVRRYPRRGDLLADRATPLAGPARGSSLVSLFVFPYSNVYGRGIYNKRGPR